MALFIFTLVPEFLMRFMVWMLVHSVYRLEKRDLDRIPDEGPATPQALQSAVSSLRGPWK